MTEQMQVVDLRIAAGRCTGRVVGAGNAEPRLEMKAGDLAFSVPDVSRDGSDWSFAVDLPATLLSDGAQAVTILDAGSGAQIGAFRLSIGEGLAYDLRAEVAQIRAELDLLKAAVRRGLRKTD